MGAEQVGEELPAGERRDNAQRCPASKARPLLLSFLYASANMSYEE